jgi:hypothetical protein
MEVAATYADGLHLEKHFIVVERRPGNFAQLDTVFLRAKIYDG